MKELYLSMQLRNLARGRNWKMQQFVGVDLMRSPVLRSKRIVLRRKKRMSCGVRRCGDPGPSSAVIPTCSLLHASLLIYAHGRYTNGSILNHDQSIKWGHFNLWNACCMLRWRSHLIPWRLTVQDHVLAGLQMLYLLYVIHLLNLHYSDTLGLGLGLLALVLLTCLLIAFLLN